MHREMEACARKRRRCTPPPMLLALLIPGVLTGCQDYLFAPGPSANVKEAQRVVPGAHRLPTDILFVVDNSGSMADEQENLARSFKAFIDEVAGNGDYHIAVVSTDLSSSTPDSRAPLERAGLGHDFYNQSFPYDRIGQDLSACLPIPDVVHGCFRGPDASRRIMTSEMSRADQIAAFQANVLLGSCGSGRETGLAAMMTALEDTRPGGCNAGFLRQDANLVVVLVSDEDDNPLEGEPERPVSDFVRGLLAIKAATQLRVAVVVGSVDGDAGYCRIPSTGTCGSLCEQVTSLGSETPCQVQGSGAGCPSGEQCGERFTCVRPEYLGWTERDCHFCASFNAPDCCSAVPGGRYIDFARRVEAEVVAADPSVAATGCRGAEMARPVACLVDSICQENFSATLARIARDLVVPSSFVLEPPAVYPEGVVVRIRNGRFPREGETLVRGTDFDVSPDGKTLRLMGPKAPAEGEDLEIFYVIER